MSKVSGSNGKPVGLLETFKNSFLFAILYNVLAFLQAINLAVVFSPSADIDQEQEEKRQNITYKQPKQAQEQLQKPKKKPATVSSKLKKNRKQQQKNKKTKSLFPVLSNVDITLKTNASVTPCSTSFDAAFVPVKNEEGQINWNLNDADFHSSTEDFFKSVNQNNQNSGNTNTDSQQHPHQQFDLPDFLSNSATCSTVSDSSPVAHNSITDNTAVQTIPNYHFQQSIENNEKSNNNNNNAGFRNFAFSGFENDDNSLNEIDLDQLANFANFNSFGIPAEEKKIEISNDDAAAAAASTSNNAVSAAATTGNMFAPQENQSKVPEIATPELKQTSKSENNTPNKLQSVGHGHSSVSSVSSISSSPELDGNEYTFANGMLNDHIGEEDEMDEDEDEDDEDFDEEKSLKSSSFSGTKKNPAKSHACPFCPAEFRIRGYLTRHIKKHAVQKAYTCPFFNPTVEHKCHPNGGFSRRDTYKTHLKARHFRYPPGTRSQDRSHVGGKCAVCGAVFETNENWVENHIENGSCPGLPLGYQCRSGSGKKNKKNRARMMHQAEMAAAAAAGLHQGPHPMGPNAAAAAAAGMGIGIGIQPTGPTDYVNNMKAFQIYEQQRQFRQMQQLQQ